MYKRQAYLVSQAVRAARVVAFEDLGMEAIYEFEVRAMPVTVAIDARGRSVHAVIRCVSETALETGLDILEALAASPAGYTLAELAQKIGRSVSEIFRMAVTLQRRGFVQVDDNDRYTLTLKMFELAHRQQPLKSLVSVALPLLRELANRARQSCHLAVYQAGRVVVIAQVDSPCLLYTSRCV